LINSANNVKRIAAIDYGNKNIGVAISDASLTVATPLVTINHKNWLADVLALRKFVEPYNVGLIVLGEPLNEDSTDSKQTIDTRLFGQQLEKQGFRVAYCDERYTSIEARETLREKYSDPNEIKQRLDQTAAAIILQRYLDQQLNNNAKER